MYLCLSLSHPDRQTYDDAVSRSIALCNTNCSYLSISLSLSCSHGACSEEEVCCGGETVNRCFKRNQIPLHIGRIAIELSLFPLPPTRLPITLKLCCPVLD